MRNILVRTVLTAGLLAGASAAQSRVPEPMSLALAAAALGGLALTRRRRTC